MLQAIVAWSIHNRVVVVVLAVLLLVAGIYAANHARLDVFPEFAPPQVVIQTEAPGMSPADVERLVTKPIEDAVNGLPHRQTLRSESIPGLSVITVIFQDGTDIYRARQLVSERLAEVAHQLPAGVKPPRMAPLTSLTGRLLTVGFTSRQLSPLELRDQVQWTIRPKLLAVPGVAQVTLYGGEVRQFQVQIIQEYLHAHHLSEADVLEAARQATGIRSAGVIENDRQRLTLRLEGQVRSAAELGEIRVAGTEGTPVRLKDVALVVEGSEPKFGDAAIYVRDAAQPEDEGRPTDPEPGVVLIVHKQLDSDTMEVTRAVEEQLQGMESDLKEQGITYHPRLFRQASFIEHALGNVAQSLVIGAILVTIVLFLFLFDVRTALISLTAIPLSLLGAVVVLWVWGVGLNTLTLGGLAIAVGEVVDDAVIDVENIFRRLRENARLGHPRSAAAVVLSASLEVRSAVVYATFIVVLVFVPVFFMTGLQGRLFAPLGYAYVLAVLASLAVALTVTPALCLVLCPRSLATPHSPLRTPHSAEPPVLRLVQRGYDWQLRRIDGDVPLVLTFVVLLVAAAGVAAWQFGGEFLPELRENHYVIHMSGLPGTSLPQSMAAGKRITWALQGEKVRSIAQQAGRAELGEDTWGVEYSELEVDLEQMNGEDAEQEERRLKQQLKDTGVGFSFEVLPFLSERIKETLSGTTGQVAVKIYGDDLDALDRVARDVAAELGRIRGRDSKPAASNVRVQQTGFPELVVRIRWEDANRFGVSPVQLLDAVHTAYQGAEVNQVYEGNRILDLAVVLAPEARTDPDMVANLRLSTETPDKPDAAPRRVQLKQVADVFLDHGRYIIGHESARRRQVVTCNVNANLDVESFVREAERRVSNLPRPAGVDRPEFTGEHVARRTAQNELLLLSAAVVAGIGLLLWMVFRSVRRLLLVLVNLPFAFVGGVAAVYLRGGILDVGSLVGFVTLFGITMRNGIMMVSHWQHLHEVEDVPWGPELVFRGAGERLAPVLMTALVTGLGLLPIALGSGEAGREIEGPMAQVILGGLVTSTGLNLFVLPVLYRRWGN
jgi:CzcA family heavy metal efflux pump